MRFRHHRHCFYPLAALVLLAATPTAFAAVGDAPPVLRELAHTHGTEGVFRVYCKKDGRVVAVLRFDLNYDTVNDSRFTLDGNTVRWKAKGANADAAPPRELDLGSFRYTGPTLNAPVASYDCEASKERQSNFMYSP